MQLPAELRQKIILLVFPSTNCVETPANFIYLSHINRLVRNDFHTLLSVWTPLHYISHPSTLTAQRPPTRGYNLSRICLDLFSAAFLGRIEWKARTVHAANYTHPELIDLWLNAVPFLPKDTKVISIDITPAPTEARSPAAERDVFLSGASAARRFLRGHVRDVAMLIKAIIVHYAGLVDITLAGRLSTKSSFFISAVSRRVGRPLSFKGTWISAADARCARLTAAVAQRLICPLARQGGTCKKHALAWLSDVVWSERTGWVYDRFAKTGYAYAVIKDVELIAKLIIEQGGEGEVVMSPDRSIFRAFQHRVARDLGLLTREEGTESERYVVVRSR